MNTAEMNTVDIRKIAKSLRIDINLYRLPI